MTRQGIEHILYVLSKVKHENMSVMSEDKVFLMQEIQEAEVICRSELSKLPESEPTDANQQ